MLRKIILCGSLSFSVSFSVLLSAGCHKKAVVLQVPFVPPTVAPETPATIPDPVPVPATTPSPVPGSVAINPGPLPPPPVTTPTKPSPFPRRSGPVTPAQVTPEPVAPVPIPTPSLGAILTADQRKQLDAEYQADLRQTNKVLNSIRNRALTPSQADSVSRARAFITQAAQYHDRDLATAAELARRARVLTQDLAGAH